MTLFVCSLYVFAEEDVTVDGIGYRLLLEAKEAYVYDSDADYSGRTKLEIPESFEYGDNIYQVTAICEMGRWGSLKSMSITIPRTITYIAQSAFNEFCTLKEVHITDLAAWCKIRFDSTPLWYSRCLFLNEEEIIDLVIPDGVTNISAQAFRRLENLKSVTLPDGMESIGYLAFHGCKNIRDVYCHAENPPSVDDMSFLSSPIEEATLHVPQASVERYREDTFWKRFGTIVSIWGNPNGIETLPASNLMKGGTGAIYDLQGRKLPKAPEKGMYIKDGKKGTFKLGKNVVVEKGAKLKVINSNINY